MSIVKLLGQVFTPKTIVEKILDEVGYKGKSIQCEYVFEPSFGDGSFLVEIVNRYIEVNKSKFRDNDLTLKELNEYIHGVEIDKELYDKTIIRLNELTTKELGGIVKWDNLHRGDTIKLYKDGVLTPRYKFVVGNPPYVSVHNMTEKQKLLLKDSGKFNFFQKSGNLYIVFLELGIDLLSKNGTLGFITPNTYIYNNSFSKFRDFLKSEKLIRKIIDFKSEKVFDDFSVYSAITIIDKKFKYETIDYVVKDEVKILPVESLNILTGGFDNFGDNVKTIGDYFNVRYGLATLADKIFISNDVKFIGDGKVLFNGHEVEEEVLKPVVKASKYDETYGTSYIIFPYEEMYDYSFIPFSESKFEETYPLTWNYLKSHKETLENRSLEKNAKWYSFGRTQGLGMLHDEKYCVSTIIKGEIVINLVPENVLMYSGMYITKKNPTTNWDIFENVITSNDFIDYINLNGKSLSGDYKNINSKLIKNYPIKT